MKLQQLRYLREVERQGLNLSAAALELHTSQPGISKQIKLLEDELGVEIFVRNGKRVTAITPPGKAILAIAQRILQDSENLKQAARDFSAQDSGKLTIATTHTQARYMLPDVVKRFTARYPQVKLNLIQGNPVQICQHTVSGLADFCIATEAIATFDELVMLPCYTWNRCVVAPPRHPILGRARTRAGGGAPAAGRDADHRGGLGLPFGPAWDTSERLRGGRLDPWGDMEPLSRRGAAPVRGGLGRKARSVPGLLRRRHAPGAGAGRRTSGPGMAVEEAGVVHGGAR